MPVVKTLCCHCKGVAVWSLLGELRSYMPCGVAQRSEKKKFECLESPYFLPLHQAVTNHIKFITYWISSEVLNVLPLCFYIILILWISIGIILQMRWLWVTELNQLVHCSKTSKWHWRFRLDSPSFYHTTESKHVKKLEKK